MKVFKISIKFEQDGEWSNRKADTEGYLVKQNDEADEVEGYVKVLYPTNSNPVRYIKGLYLKNGALAFLQMCNDFSLSPICYSFPDVKKDGYWSDFHETMGFFPVYPSAACSKGHAKISIEEITNESVNEIERETSEIFEKNSNEATWVNQCLMQDAGSLTDFLNDEIIFQMKLHCGKW